ncbi:MAG: hypothetical protein IKD62_00860 [Oscillospiraceae bacterium]|nr:hypothetical protein [Oscillospiraceae bacterium]
MTSKEFDSLLLRELRKNVPNMNGFNTTQTFEYFESVMPPEEVVKFRRVLLTGCGDSYCAGLAAKPVFENIESFKGTGQKPGIPTEAHRNIEFSRYYNTYRGWDYNGPNAYRTLLCAISVSGGPVRPREALLRMKEKGGGAVAFTNNPNSLMAQAADWVVNYNMTPSEGPVPNVRSYQASVFSLMMFALYMSVCKGIMTREEAEKQRTACMAYINAFSGSKMAEIEEKAFQLSQDWEERGIENMDFVADGPDYSTSFFGSAKMVESFGGLTTHDDSEDWLHINFFIRKPEKVGTFIIANESSKAFSRELETIKVMLHIGRPLAIITDAEDLSVFPEGATIFQLPKSKVRWANPLMQHIPMDYVAAFTGLLRKASPYRREDGTHPDVKPHRFIDSKLVIV